MGDIVDSEVIEAEAPSAPLKHRVLQRSGFVYFIRCLEANAVKIGKAIDVTKRLGGLQVACPFELKLYAGAWVLDARAAELELHERFDDDRIRGEWFRFTDAIRDYAHEMARRQAALARETLMPEHGVIINGRHIRNPGGFTYQGIARKAPTLPPPQPPDWSNA